MLPDYLLSQLKNSYSNIDSIIEGYNKNRFTSLRVNTLKANTEEIIKILIEKEIPHRLSSFSQNAIIIEDQSSKLLQDPSYKNGLFYLQSLSSQLPALYLDLTTNQDILDMAAAPGGKTSQIAALTNNESRILACEKDRYRFEKLNHNLKLLNVKAQTLLTDSLKLDDNMQFDTILLDAPCSGTGTIAINDEKTYRHFSSKLLKNLTDLQLKMLIKALKLLKKNKTMIYSTCSILKCENEDIILKAQKSVNFEIVEITQTYDLPLYPSKIKGTITVAPNEYYEGFFIAKLKRL